MDSRKRYYDKFGFFSIEPEKEDSFDQYERESRNRRRSPAYGRNSRERSNYSPDNRNNYRNERKEYREGKNEEKWRNREYSPLRNREFLERNQGVNRNDQMDFDNNWELNFNPSQDFINPPPAPSFTNEPPPPPHFPPNENYNQQFSTTPSYNFIDPPLPPPSHIMDPIPTPPPAPNLQQGNWTQVPPQEDKMKKEAIALEMRNQRATLARQKEDYFKKLGVLKRELDSLKQQRIELRGDTKRSPSPDSQRFLKENAKLQTEIISKIKSFDNIIDMLNGIIGDKSTLSNEGEKTKKSKSGKNKSPLKSTSSRDSSSSENDKKSSSRSKKRKSRSRSKAVEKKFNFVFYDPEMHWCRICNEFPTTAKNFLNHLHTPAHQKNAMTQIEAPWHSATNMNEGVPNFPGAPSKRTPIKGLQFFVPSSAWFCKLCDQWIGDLHCASAHLKSLVHTENYTNFVELNPHWEMDWMSDRQKNFEKVHKTAESEKKPEYCSDTVISFQADGIHTKKKVESSPQSIKNDGKEKTEKSDKRKKDKKKSKKKHYSSSESSSSSDSEDERKKKKLKKEDNRKKLNERMEKDERQGGDEKETSAEDAMISQWMSLKQDTLTDQDKKILERLKNSVKTKATEKPEQKIDNRVMSREREARDLLSIQGDRARKLVEKMDSNSRGSRGKDDDKAFGRYYAEPKGHLSKRERDEQNEDKFDRHSTDKQKKAYKESVVDKKMPFIGKMPLFKSLTNRPSKAEMEPPKPSLEECVEAAKKKRDEINAQIQKSVGEMKEKLQKSLSQKEAANSIPAPGLALPTALASASTLSKPPNIPFPQMIHRIQKSPVKVIPPTKKAPSPQLNVQTTSKGDPLHKDFQDALDIIFPSAETAIAPKEEIPPLPQQVNPNMEMFSQEAPPGWMQQNYMGPMGPAPMGPMGMMGPMGPMGPMGHMGPMGPMGPMAPMPPMGPPMGYPDQSYPTMPYNMGNNSSEYEIVNKKDEVDDDLAMLGIDAEDVGASGF